MDATNGNMPLRNLMEENMNALARTTTSRTLNPGTFLREGASAHTAWDMATSNVVGCISTMVCVTSKSWPVMLRSSRF